MDWWSLQCSLSQKWGQPSNQGQVGKAYCFPILGSWSVINWVPSGESSVVTLMRQWNGHPKSRSKLAQPIIWTWSSTSPAPKSSARFSNTPIVESTLVFADVMCYGTRQWHPLFHHLSSSAVIWFTVYIYCLHYVFQEYFLLYDSVTASPFVFLSSLTMNTYLLRQLLITSFPNYSSFHDLPVCSMTWSVLGLRSYKYCVVLYD